MNDKNRIESALKVATSYYRDGWNQNDIVTELDIPRATVSRLLQFGRDRGLVIIRTHNPVAPLHQLEVDLLAKYPSLHKITVVPGTDDPLEEAGVVGAKYIEQVVEDKDIIGLGWGKAVCQVGLHLKPKDVTGITTAQMKGSMANINTRNYVFEMVNIFANAFNTAPQYLSSPVIFGHTKTRELVANDTHIKYILELGEQSNIAVFTVEIVRDSALLFKLGYFTKQEQLTLQHEAVGGIFSRFIDSKGQIVNEDISQRTIGITLPELREKKHSILVAANVAKVPAVHGVLTADYANTLVIDQESANSLANSLN